MDITKLISSEELYSKLYYMYANTPEIFQNLKP